MMCPKCGGGAFLADEDLIRVTENTEPLKVMIKQTFTCRACGERFSRIVWDDMDARKKGSEMKGASSDLGVETLSLSEREAADSDDRMDEIRFTDKI